MTEQIQKLIQPMFGQLCCKQRVWKHKSLWLGFGEKLYHGNERLIDPYYGEWEIGTYYSAWRIVKHNQILCGSGDLVDSVEELHAKLKQIELGRILSLSQPTVLDVRAEFDTGVAVDFLAAMDEDVECFGIRHGPSHLAVEFTLANGWRSGPSNSPWEETEVG